MVLFVADLGNKQTKIKSESKTLVLPSHFVEASQYGNRELMNFAKSEKDAKDFISSRDEDFTYVWGKDLDEDIVDVVTDTIGFGSSRYSGREFRLLTDFALGELAFDYQEAKDGILEVSVVTGVPTSDYAQSDALTAIQKAFKGDHNVKVHGVTLNIRVKDLIVLPQPLGTVIDQISDENGNMIENSITNATVGVVDVGGGTVLIDALRKMNMAENGRDQLQRGAFTLYEAIKKELVAEGYTINEYEIETVVRDGNERESYLWSPDGNQTINITDIVMKQRKLFTRNIASSVKTTYKSMERMQTVLVTGGAANLLIKDEFVKEIKEAKFVEESELANVRGFYKFGLAEGV